VRDSVEIASLDMEVLKRARVSAVWEESSRLEETGEEY